MKRTTQLLLPIAVLFSLSACSDPADKPNNRADAGVVAPDAMAQIDIDAGPGAASIELVGRAMLPIAADVAADPARNLVAVAGFQGGVLTLIDVSDPAVPSVLSSTDIGYHSDVQFLGTTLYVNHEGLDRGIDIYDTTNPANPQLVNMISQNDGSLALNQCHNLWPVPDRDLLYCASTETGEVVIMSIGNGGVGSPTAPVFLNSFGSPNGGIGVHDVYAKGNRLYVAFLNGGMAIYDNTTPSTPVLLGTHMYEGNFTHNLWPTPDGNYLLTTDEVVGGKLQVWDISDPANIQFVTDYGQNDNAVIHNVEMVGDRAYISYYTEGLTVLDVSDPTAPTLLVADDYVTGPDADPKNPFSGFRGAWGVEPVPPLVYVSDIETGLLIYRVTN